MKKRNAIIIAVASVIVAAVVAAVAVGLYAFIAFILGGYNPIMREYLGNAENYETFELVCRRAYYYDDNTKDGVTFDAETNFDDIHTVYLKCVVPSDDVPDGYNIVFELTKENAKLLSQSGFYSDLCDGEKLFTVRATFWIYMDNEFNFVAEIKDGENVYLDFERGFDNIVSLMNENRIF